MMDIIIDTKGNFDLINRDQLLESDDDDNVEIKTIDVDPSRIYDAEYLGIKTKEQEEEQKRKPFSDEDFNLEEFETDMGWKSSRVTFEPTQEIMRMRKEINPLNKILEKTVIKPGFEQLHVVPPYELSKRQLELHKRREKQKQGTGAGWFNMRAPQITPEIRHDLEILRMRSALDPKRFYKKNDMTSLPKHFHVGKVIDSPMDFYSSRLTNKERKKTVVDELMADANFKKYNKRKYMEIVEEKKKTHYKAHKHAKKLKGKKK